MLTTYYFIVILCVLFMYSYNVSKYFTNLDMRLNLWEQDNLRTLTYDTYDYDRAHHEPPYELDLNYQNRTMTTCTVEQINKIYEATKQHYHETTKRIQQKLANTLAMVEFSNKQTFASTILLDIGANKGLFSGVLMTAFCQDPLIYYQYVQKNGKFLYPEPDGSPNVWKQLYGAHHDQVSDKCAKIYAFEPHKGTCGSLNESATIYSYPRKNFQAINIGFADTVGTTKITGTAGDEINGIRNVQDIQPDVNLETDLVFIYTLDYWLQKKSDFFLAIDLQTSTIVAAEKTATEKDEHDENLKSKILFAKIDTEGFEPNVIRGMKSFALKYGVIDFFLFEYGDNWKTMGTGRLTEAVDIFDSFGYDSFFISENHMIPINGMYWKNNYEDYKWKDILSINRNMKSLQMRNDFIKLWTFFSKVEAKCQF